VVHNGIDKQWNVETSVARWRAKICVLCSPDDILTKLLPAYTEEISKPTKRIIGLDFYQVKNIKIDDNIIRLLLIVISTQFCFASSCPTYFQGASAAVFAFSKSKYSFVESTIGLFYEFRRHIPEPTVPIAFVGLHDEVEVVPQTEGLSLAQEFGVDSFEMAVDDLQTLDAVLKSLLQKVMKKISTFFWSLVKILIIKLRLALLTESG